jgi:hypothetical protein
LGDFFEVFHRNADILVEQIINRLTDSEEIDIFPMMSRCTLDIISGNDLFFFSKQVFSVGGDCE